MLDFGFYNMDCMEGMKQFPDKYFDLAVCDPPYGINIGGIIGGGVAQSRQLIKPLMILKYQMWNILENWREFQSIELYGVAITSLII